jgi:hypothetical protein
MSWLRSLATFAYEFIVGDDWTIAIGVAIALALTAIVAELGPAWFVTPIAVLVLLGLSVWRASRPTP